VGGLLRAGREAAAVSAFADQPLPPQVVRSPEGVDLQFGAATASERLVALAFDLAIVSVIFVVCGFLFAFTLGLGPVLLTMFVLRHGYFLWFEARGRGTTPGKRRYHLRVIRADGGPLTTEILLARNLTREIELFLPLMLLVTPDVLFADHTGVLRTVATLWVLGLLFFPLTNAQRLRIGDLLAGTRVVLAPPVGLARDLADGGAQPKVATSAAAEGTTPPPAAEFVFTAAQLGIYGEHELIVLEQVLRKARQPGAEETLAAVTAAICKRLGLDAAAVPQKRRARFLQAFYTAQREHLEQGLLLGKRRLRKEAAAPPAKWPKGPRGW